MKKTEIIQRLLDENKITAEEAMILLQQDPVTMPTYSYQLFNPSDLSHTEEYPATITYSSRRDN